MAAATSSLRPTWIEAVLILTFGALCSAQLFLPPTIGLANNGDFAKVHARYSIRPADGGDRNFAYFVAEYPFDRTYYWAGDVVSAENVLAGIPILLVRASGAKVFDIRWLAALHLTIYLLAYAVLLVYLRRFGRAWQVGLGLLAIWVFTDIAYVAYFNSFFNDSAALLGLVLMVAAALHVSDDEASRPAAVWLFAAAGVLFITSKSQHAIWGVFPLAFALWRRRWVAAAAFSVALLFMVANTSADYTAHSLFSVTFHKLIPRAQNPEAAFQEMGLSKDDRQYIGMHPYLPGAPHTLEWYTAFYRRVGYGKVLRYWVHYPDEGLAALRMDWVMYAGVMRPLTLGNYRKEDGFVPGAKADHFNSWSSLRGAFYRSWPGAAAAAYLLLIAGAVIGARRGLVAPGAAMICAGLAAMALLEFGVVALADAVEVERHLFLFQALTDLCVCFAAAAAVSLAMRVWSARSADRERSALPVAG